MTITCKVTIGDPDSVEVKEFYGTASFDEATQGSKTYDDQNSGEEVTDSGVTKRDDKDFYALQKSVLSKETNVIQKCLAQFPIYKIDRDATFFYEYEVTLGARLYTSKTDTAPTQLAETTYEMELETIEYPDFDEEEY
jgi:hypothetical protein